MTNNPFCSVTILFALTNYITNFTLNFIHEKVDK